MNKTIENTQRFVENFKKVGAVNIRNLDNFAKAFGDIDKSVLGVAKNVMSGKSSIEELDSAMSNATNSSAKFAASLKSIAANVGIMLAVNIAIKALASTWDALNVTVEEQEQKINELKSSYEGLKSEYEQLSQKQDVTDAEKRRLHYRNARLPPPL